MGEKERTLTETLNKTKNYNKVVSQQTKQTTAFKTKDNLLPQIKKTKPTLCINSIHNMRFVSITLLFLITISFLPTASAIPNSISVQGKLTDASGTVLTGDYDFTFYMYDELTNGNILWSESQTLAVNRGIFSAIMGDTNTDTTFNQLDFNATKYLAIEVEGTMQTPRIEMASTTSAMRAQTANDLNSTSDNNATNISISGNTFLNNLFVSGNQTYTGDSNFTNIGISGNSFLNALFATTFRTTGDVTIVGDFNNSGKAAFNGLINYIANSVLVQDLNTLGDINTTGSIQATAYYGSGAALTGVTATSGWPADTTIDTNTTAYNSIQTDLNTFFIKFLDSNNTSRLTYTTIADAPWAIGTIMPDTTLDTNATADANWLGNNHIFTGDNNFANLEATNTYLTNLTTTNDANFIGIQATTFFGDGSKLTGITTDINGTNISPANIQIEMQILQTLD